jgi:hypothetical protein
LSLKGDQNTKFVGQILQGFIHQIAIATFFDADAHFCVSLALRLWGC